MKKKNINQFNDSEIADAVVSSTADNVRSDSEFEVDQPAEKSCCYKNS